VLVGILLVGIVFFNVSVMRLNQTITRDSARATTLRQENSRLGVEKARLSSAERIQRLAVARGFVLPVPQEVRYLDLNLKRDAIRAGHRIVPPQLMVAPPPVSQVPESQQAQPPAGATGATGPSGTTGQSGTTGPAITTPTTGTQTGTTGQTGTGQGGITQTGTTPTQTGTPGTTTGGTSTGGVTSGGGAP
jgi:cell division protein FtsL